MGQKIRTLTMLTLLFSATSISTHAEAPLAEQPHQQQAQPSWPRGEIAAQIQRIATLPSFQAWQAATAQPVRALHSPAGRQHARLWSVHSNGQEAGYLVTSPDGQHVYEFSRGAVPALPKHLQGQELTEGYIYAGPMLHLVYLHAEGGGFDLYNLRTEETLPWGELLNNVPVPAAPITAAQPVTERPVAISASPDSEALYATGRWGQHKWSGTSKGVHPLPSYAAGDTFDRSAYLVYDAIPDRLTVSLQVTSIIQQGATRYLQLRDPFTPGSDRVYIDSRFPVSVVLTASSVT